MAIASNLSGKAINLTKTTAPHALSYQRAIIEYPSWVNAVALILGRFFIINEYNKEIQVRKKEYEKIIDSLYNILDVKNAKEAFTFWYKFMVECGLEIDFKKIGLKNKKLIFKNH